MHHSAGGHHQSVVALLNALDMTMYWMIGDLGPSTSTETARQVPLRSGAPFTSGSVQVARTGGGMVSP
jgi:hypothetical protein